MGARPDPQIIAAPPVGQVVPAGFARPGMVGDLVGGQASAGQVVPGRLIEGRLERVVGQRQPALRLQLMEPGAGLDGQLVEAEMAARQRQGARQLRPPGSDRLAGSGIDQIERVALEQAGRLADRRQRAGLVVLAAEAAERRIVERLDAERQPVDAGRLEAHETCGLNRGRVGFQGHLEIGRQLKRLRRGLENRGAGLGRHQGRRAAAEEDRGQPRPLGCPGAQPLRLVRQLPAIGGRPARLIDHLAGDMAVEVAIGAFDPAERPMDIEAEACGTAQIERCRMCRHCLCCQRRDYHRVLPVALPASRNATTAARAKDAAVDSCIRISATCC